MKTVKDFPNSFSETEDCWIPLADGTRLAAKLWLPAGSDKRPVPTLLEALPYRKRDAYAMRDSQIHRYFAGHGYATMRLDLRGSGDSGGVQENFGAVQEQDDTIEVLRWIARQPWSDGQVGMFGISWGGYQAIQVAFRAPPELKAVIPISFATDRYTYGQVYRGGALLQRAIRWSSQIFGYKSRPPDPALVGDGWREMWMERLEHVEPMIANILQNQSHNEFWKARAITDFKRIKCPVYAISGWADGSYVGSVFETISKIDAPWKALVGPWGHRYSHIGLPGPAIGFLQEALRWFDHWMRGRDTGIMKEPQLRAWIAEDVPARTYYDESPGRWVTEPTWPSAAISAKRLVLNPGKLASTAEAAQAITFCTPQTLGLDGGELMPWFLNGPSPDMPGDQRADDGKSVVFDSAPLGADVEILGAPAVKLDIAVDRPAAFVAVRLCDVAPDGASKRVTYGILNLTHRRGAERPAPLQPGERFTVDVPLVEAGYRFKAGHRIRLAISTTYWPLIWPSPKPVSLTLHTGTSTLDLPLRDAAQEAAEIPAFAEPEVATAVRRTVLKPGSRKRTFRTDPLSGAVTVDVADTPGRYRLDDINLEVESWSTESYEVVEGDPLSAVGDFTWTWIFERDDWKVRTDSRIRLTSTKSDFVLHATMDAFEGERRVFSRNYDYTILRRGN
ncbi:CocE/NonD family hydrolase [Bradyrhizobium sp. LHD-71]|uniref:CocE/NonD family hydrolase n=1 Tax=Bradyrhizobium sp. LHD-71 TaxID=3072141 RepID=UPI00280FD341|nr:CocE/NonD family hydrolase [Bradyrhizobium sp. LHD-71]MDQ8727692.1 CocE/NonD family hydrolase [Bradyrhizobium sp. LHD-71]